MILIVFTPTKASDDVFINWIEVFDTLCAKYIELSTNDPSTEVLPIVLPIPIEAFPRDL